MDKVSPQIEESWKRILAKEFNAPYFLELKKFLLEEKNKYTIYPSGGYVFNAFNHTPFDQVKVVII